MKKYRKFGSHILDYSTSLQNRRSFIQNCASVGFVTTLGTPELLTTQKSQFEPNPLVVNQDKIWEICSASIESAKAAGATYADVRMTYTSSRSMSILSFGSEVMGIGLRVLVDGYWGFASSPIWSVDEAARLGQAAVRQAKACCISGPKHVDIAPVKIIESGQWIMPVNDDPFELNPDEIYDYLNSISVALKHWPGVNTAAASVGFRKTDKYFVSTYDQKVFQRTYLSSANILIVYLDKTGRNGHLSIDSFTPAGKGFDYIRNSGMRNELRAGYEELLEDLSLPVKPLEVGRYPILLDSSTVANLLHKTIGPATELDRILGYEANSTGTSFINDPKQILQSYRVASDKVTVTSDRSVEGSAGTVKWDDDGVAPKDVVLIDRGLLKGVQTDSERSGWLNRNLSGYHINSSTGSMVTDNAQTPPNIFSGNLTLSPGEDSSSDEALIKEMGDGVYIKHGSVDVDFQLSSGVVSGNVYEVRNGKRIASLQSAGILFNTLDLWKSALRIGGSDLQRTFGLSASKTNYGAQATTSVTSSPVIFREGTVIDLTRKA